MNYTRNLYLVLYAYFINDVIWLSNTNWKFSHVNCILMLSSASSFANLAQFLDIRMIYM